MSIQYFNRLRSPIMLLLLAMGTNSCTKLVEIPSPQTLVSTSEVYSSQATAIAAVTGIYTSFSQDDAGHYSIGSVFLYASMSADELALYDVNNFSYFPFYANELTNQNVNVMSYWRTIYPIIYMANSAMAGLTGNAAIPAAVDKQLLGEARFDRAFCYFYLVNFYGDVPLVTGIDYTVNEILPRAPRDSVYGQMIADLKEAEVMLSPNFVGADLVSTTPERVRPTSWAASALLARTYLYTQKWDSAEMEATKVINSSLFSLDTLNGVFLANSKESIWQWQPTLAVGSGYTGEGQIFVLPSTGPSAVTAYPVYLGDHLLNSFEPGDQRRTAWVDSVLVGGVNYRYPYKYKMGTGQNTIKEYVSVLRLAEQYLIRAEARARQGELAGGTDDLNVIRTRAGLGPVSPASSEELLADISHERQIELFTEWGNRWFDLKRTGAVDTVMGPPGNVTKSKGGVWNTNQQLYPIDLVELQSDPALVQNPGY